MAFVNFPTSKDIYVEIDGKRLAAAQGYKSKTARESRYVEAFGAAEPVGTVGGRLKYLLELTRVAICESVQQADINFHTIDNFNVVIVKPDRKIIYSGCQWTAIDETVALSDLVYETLTVVARSRLEVRV